MIFLTIKPEKTVGFDEIYTEFIKNSETRSKKWTVSFFNDILRTGRISKLFQQVKFITNLQPEKDCAEFAAQYRFQIT
jgi:hypothetical protein